MSGDHNMRGEDDDEISTSTHFLPKPKTYGCDQNEFSPDWDQMAVLVEQSQEQAAKIEHLEAKRLQDRNAMDAMKLANEQWSVQCRQLEKKLAERSAEHLAAHITYDKGYQAGRDDTKDAEAEFNRGIEAAQHRLMQMHRIATERHNLYHHAALELNKLKEPT